jgi:hypothetical protein
LSHLGKVSKGFKEYFSFKNEVELRYVLSYRYEDQRFFLENQPKEVLEKYYQKKLSDLFKYSVSSDFNPEVIAYNICAEDYNFSEYYKMTSEIVKKNFKDVYTYIYLRPDRLQEIEDISEINEVRFTLLPSFKDEHLDILKKAKEKHGFIVSVEEYSWPLHRKNILNMLAQLNGLIDHLILKEVEVNIRNKHLINEAYNDAQVYKDTFYYVYDEGLVYDVMKEATKMNASFSVVDYNSFFLRYIEPESQGSPLFNFIEVEEENFLERR